MEYVFVGKIVQTHGIKGELRIRSNFEFKDRVFKKGINLFIGQDKIKEEINSYRHHKDFEMVTFSGYDNINQVLKYLKMNVYVDKNDLNMDKDEYILDDLIGLEVYENEELLGTVLDVVDSGNNILLEVNGLKKFYIPNHSNFIKKVDLNKKTIIVENAKGLML